MQRYASLTLVRTVVAMAILSVATGLPMIAKAADHSLGSDPADKCASLAEAGAGALKIDSATLIDAKSLSVADSAPTPASRTRPPRDSAACSVISSPSTRRRPRSASS